MLIGLNARFNEEKNGELWRLNGYMAFGKVSTEEIVSQIKYFTNKYKRNLVMDVVIQEENSTELLAFRYCTDCYGELSKIYWKDWICEKNISKKGITTKMEKLTKKNIRDDIGNILNEYSEYYK